MQRLAAAVEEFAALVRSHPADSVGPGLDRLVQLARSDPSGSFSAQMSPEAPITWMTRAVLPAAQQATGTIPLFIPYPCTLVGAHTTIALIDPAQGLVEAPPALIDVKLQINRKDEYTARADQQLAQTEDSSVVNLGALDATIANRLLRLDMPENENHVGVVFRWATPLANVAAFGYGDLQISINWFVDPKIKGRGWTGGA
jgi:hypothetical protein